MRKEVVVADEIEVVMVRVPATLKQRIAESAKANGRSLSKEAGRALAREFEAPAQDAST
jgi:hypothetical protein